MAASLIASADRAATTSILVAGRGLSDIGRHVGREPTPNLDARATRGLCCTRIYEASAGHAHHTNQEMAS